MYSTRLYLLIKVFCEFRSILGKIASSFPVVIRCLLPSVASHFKFPLPYAALKHPGWKRKEFSSIQCVNSHCVIHSTSIGSFYIAVAWTSTLPSIIKRKYVFSFVSKLRILFHSIKNERCSLFSVHWMYSKFRFASYFVMTNDVHRTLHTHSHNKSIENS